MENLKDKIATLSPGLRQMIVTGERKYTASPNSPITNWLVHNKRHCNGGRTVDAGLKLREHCQKGGKIFLTMSGAGSSFQLGVCISELIRAGLIGGISVTAANLEESMYRLVANSHYAYIPNYSELTPAQEKELDHAGLRRITDTFLPEEESVRQLLPRFEELWRESNKQDEPRFWHDYFFEIFRRDWFTPDPTTSVKECWLYQAWAHEIPVFVPGVEDSTMGNIFAYYCYGGDHPFLKKYRNKEPISPDVVHHSFRYMHALAEHYMTLAKVCPQGLAFLQLGGGIGADSPICVVPHLKKDFLADETIKTQEKLIPPWRGFVEIFSSPMSYGSYSGAGGKEKITWSKLEPDAFMMQICGDYTEHFPDIAAIMLAK